jgi:hypothetical protein
MADFIEQFAGELSKQVSAKTLDAIENRLAELARKQFKPFFTFKEMSEMFNCSVTTLRRLKAKGVLATTRGFSGATGCTTWQIDDYFKRMEVRAGAREVKSGNVFQIKRSA